MSTVNKELYDALLAAKVPEEKASAAALVDGQVTNELASLNARMALVEKVMYGVLVGVIGLLIKAYILP